MGASLASFSRGAELQKFNAARNHRCSNLKRGRALRDCANHRRCRQIGRHPSTTNPRVSNQESSHTVSAMRRNEMIRRSSGSTRASLVWATANRLLFAARVVTPVIYVAGLLLSPSTAAAAEVQYVVKPVAEMKVKQLPKGPLYWRIENFPTLERAKVPVEPRYGELRRIAFPDCRGRRQDLAFHARAARRRDARRNEGG